MQHEVELTDYPPKQIKKDKTVKNEILDAQEFQSFVIPLKRGDKGGVSLP